MFGELTTFCSQLSNLVKVARSCEVNARWKMSEEKLPHWIEENIRPKSYMWVCSECGRTAYDMPMYSKKRYVKICSLAYCPHCGVKMVGEQEVRDKK